MIDFHSHILPAVDDGSQSIEESLALLKMLSEQEIDTVFATPHFLANRDSVDSFLSKREEACARLCEAVGGEGPSIVRGAEVAYYPGISRLSGLERLRSEKGRLLLLEMPMTKWTEFTLRELSELSSSGEFTLAIAHMERYMAMQSATVLEELYQNRILIQCNASFFNEFFTRGRALSMLYAGEIHLLGSDCHGLKTRPPQIGNAFARIRRKLGDRFLSHLDEHQHSLIHSI